MNWMEKILNSDAGRARPDEARRIIEEAGGVLEGFPSPCPDGGASVSSSQVSPGQKRG